MASPIESKTGDEAYLNRLLNTILETAVEVLGFDAATVSARSGESIATLSTTDERMRALDYAQYASMDGPCIEALTQRQPIYVEDLTRETRWYMFREAAETTGVRTVLSLHVDTGTEVVSSALNLYARREYELSDETLRSAESFTVNLAAALKSIDVFRATARLAERLADAMLTRAGIEQAKGILMAERGISADEAFAVLREESQHTNTKLMVVAARLVRDRRERRGELLPP